MDPVLGQFRDPSSRWFTEALGAPTRAQQLGWPAIGDGRSTLLLAPTGSGKTLAAFMVAIDRLLFSQPPSKSRRCRVLYVSPLKALAVDVEKNLRAPLAGISDLAARLGVRFHEVLMSIRTGDTPQQERARFARTPTDILITTPESLFLLLTSAARDALRSIDTVIVDEIHAVVGTKRGSHLSLSLERLERLVEQPLQRIGLSATQRPLDEVARFLGGFRGGQPREVSIVDAGQAKALDLRVEVAIADAGRSIAEEAERHHCFAPQSCQIAHGSSTAPEPTGTIRPSGRHGLWQAVHPMILSLIRSHRSTLIFVNNRRLAERLAGSLNELAGDELVQAHHGSIAREQRLAIEEGLKSGRLPGLVATSSLELGIDMGAIDLVIQVEAPPSVAGAMQRIGRAGHRIGEASKGIILPKYRGDLLACAAITERMHAGAVEEMRYPRNPLDVLAQQIVAMVSTDPWTVDGLFEVVRGSAPFAELPRQHLEGVLDMLSGRYPSHLFAELRPRVTWDRATGDLMPRESARRVVVGQAGTIPDRGLYGVFLSGSPKGQGRVGELEEVMVFESRVGDVFVLGASSWRIEQITPDRVIVSPAPGVPGRMPFWHGENLGRPLELGRRIGALAREMHAAPRSDAVAVLQERHDLSYAAALDLLDYLDDQARAGALPTDRTVVVERHRDEMGDWRVCILSPFGSRVLSPLAMAIGAHMRERTGVETDILWTDNGIIIRLPEVDEPPDVSELLPSSDAVEGFVIRQLAAGGGAVRQPTQGAPVTALFASRFREAAARALLLPHHRPGHRSALWRQRKRAADLLHVVGRYDDFPIVLETYREILKDVFDMPALVALLRQIEAREVAVEVIDTPTPSPFAAAILFNYVANFMYEGDAPLAERRAQALTVDPVRLRQLMGDVELRDLLSLEALNEVQHRLQRLPPETHARSSDGVHDLLLRLGDLSAEELRVRSADAARLDEWLTSLATAARIVPVSIGAEERWIAAEDAARYRDALGVRVPESLPAPLLAPVQEPLEDLVVRYAATHGPFTVAQMAARFATGVAPLESALRRLEAGGRVLQGEFRPGGIGREWCDAHVLAAVRGKSLAALRKEVEPVGQDGLARFALAWHGIAPCRTPRAPARQASSPHRLLEIVRRLQGAALPASVLESQILRARLPEYDPRELDALMAAGRVMWVGAGRLGEHDGRVRLLLTDDAPYLAPPPGPALPESRLSGVGQQIVEYLETHGASFYPAIQRAAGGYPPDVLEALWLLVWDGRITNDTLQPVREYLNPQRDRKTQEMARRLPGPTGRYRPLIRSPLLVAGRLAPVEASGRWSLVASLIGAPASETDSCAAAMEQLLERHGLVTRETATAEGIEGGFASVYPVARALEDAGRVRRGYFVDGLGASQFALPGALDRLRATREPADDLEAVVLAACDPANLYGAALPWPDRPEGRRPGRAAGASVVLVNGWPTAWLSPVEKRLMVLDRDDERAVASAEAASAVIVSEIRGGRLGSLLVEEVEAPPAVASRWCAALEHAGFHRMSRGWLCRR